MSKKVAVIRREHFNAAHRLFNPGWDENAKNTESFNDVREIQQHLKKAGIPLSLEADSTTSGPASIMLKDPDGNVILIDQHR